MYKGTYNNNTCRTTSAVVGHGNGRNDHLQAALRSCLPPQIGFDEFTNLLHAIAPGQVAKPCSEGVTGVSQALDLIQLRSVRTGPSLDNARPIGQQPLAQDVASPVQPHPHVACANPEHLGHFRRR